MQLRGAVAALEASAMPTTGQAGERLRAQTAALRADCERILQAEESVVGAAPAAQRVGWVWEWR